MIFEYDMPEEDLIYVELYHHDCDTKWKYEYATSLLDMTNEELFEEMLVRQRADDYDGGYTDEQEWKADKTAEIVKTQLMPSHWDYLKYKNFTLYSSIENTIVDWVINGNKTADTLTREVMKILSLHDDTTKTSESFKRASLRTGRSLGRRLTREELLNILNLTDTENLEELTVEELLNLYKQY